jgi:hypothetical protein
VIKNRRIENRTLAARTLGKATKVPVRRYVCEYFYESYGLKVKKTDNKTVLRRGSGVSTANILARKSRQCALSYCKVEKNWRILVGGVPSWGCLTCCCILIGKQTRVLWATIKVSPILRYLNQRTDVHLKYQVRCNKCQMSESVPRRINFVVEAEGFLTSC